MNRTETAKRELCEKMLKGQIDVEEVAMISGVPLEEVQKLRDEMDRKERQALGGMTVREMGVGSVIIDDESVPSDDIEPED